MNLKLCVLCAACFGATAHLEAQSVLFSDTLAVDTSNWTTGTPPNQGGGALTFANSALTYTTTSPSAGTDDAAFRYLSAYQAFPTFSWTAQVDIHLAALGGLVSGQYANLNLIVGKASDPFNYSADIALDRYHNGSSLVLDIDAYIKSGLGNEIHLGEILNATTDATLLIGYDMSTGFLTYAYDVDGAANGYSFTAAYTSVNISGWGMGPTDPFVFYLVGGSGSTDINISGPTISAADAYFTNFVITNAAPVPEPATYTVLAGVIALGFAFWLRRRCA